MANGNGTSGSFFSNLLEGDVVVFLEMDWSTIFKLMAGLIGAIVIANIISKRL